MIKCLSQYEHLFREIDTSSLLSIPKPYYRHIESLCQALSIDCSLYLYSFSHGDVNSHTILDSFSFTSILFNKKQLLLSIDTNKDEHLNSHGDVNLNQTCINECLLVKNAIENTIGVCRNSCFICGGHTGKSQQKKDYVCKKHSLAFYACK